MDLVTPWTRTRGPPEGTGTFERCDVGVGRKISDVDSDSVDPNFGKVSRVTRVGLEVQGTGPRVPTLDHQWW